MEAAAELECSTADRDKYKEKRDKERQKERAKVEKDKENDEGTGKQNGHRHILKLFFDLHFNTNVIKLLALLNQTHPTTTNLFIRDLFCC